MFTQRLLQLMIVGGSEWVMVLLLGLSVISIAFIIERAIFFRRHSQKLFGLDAPSAPMLRQQDLAAARKHVLTAEYAPLVVAVTVTADNIDAGEKAIFSALSRERLKLERRLAFLGTLGNNAPFIGLFGTVLGIIRAFHDLSLDQGSGAKTVMAGISEALVATAIGLFVAIPAVIAFNYFQRRVDQSLSITEALAHSFMAHLSPSTQTATSWQADR
jgi:biopolymer transport protein ExbB/TolQ